MRGNERLSSDFLSWVGAMGSLGILRVLGVPSAHLAPKRGVRFVGYAKGREWNAALWTRATTSRLPFLTLASSPLALKCIRLYGKGRARLMRLGTGR